jgi:hypothetical protein
VVDDLRVQLVDLDDPSELSVADIVSAAEVLTESADEASAAAVGAFGSAYDELAIVNPEKTKFAKTVMTETYYELIRWLANELERETSVLFVVGFSFRDEHLRSILLRAARTNPTLQIVVFCYMAADRKRYAELMPESAIPNGNVQYLAPQDDDVRYDLDTVVSRFLIPLLDPASRVGLEDDAPET